MKSIYDKQYNVLIDLLKKKRKHAGLTQGQLASKIGKDQTYVSKYENRVRRLDIIELKEICGALGINFVDFIVYFESMLKPL